MGVKSPFAGVTPTSQVKADDVFLLIMVGY
jgi:hypothetical protein